MPKLWRRRFLAAALTFAGLYLTACENPDFTDVRFKPARVDPKAFKTALKAYVFLRKPQEVVWGNEFLYHSRSLPEREFRPLAGQTMTIDEAILLTTDDTGLIAIDGMAEGYHTMRFAFDGKKYVTHFRVKREQVTLIVVEIKRDGLVNTSTTQVPHSFLTVKPFQRLLVFHQAVEKVMALYEGARQGRDFEKWSVLLADDYADGKGGKEDFLRALRLRGAADPGARVMGRNSELLEKTAAVVVRVQNAGNPDFIKLDLKDDRGGAWKISAIND
jgi:hypothetical protein